MRWLAALLFAGLIAGPTHAAPNKDRGLDVLKARKPLEDGLGIGNYRAILFSAQDYPDPSGIPDLDTPNRDVTEIARVLETQYGFETEVVTDATEQAIISRLDRLKRETEEGDAVIVYFAGHGLYDEAESRGYWLPTDAQLTSTSRWVSNDDVSAKLRAIPARHVLMIIDSCFSGMFRDVPRPTTEAELRALKTLADKRSRVVLSSGSNEPVSDGGRDGMSVFAYFLRQSLLEAKGRYVVLDTLFPELRSRVQQNAPQTPQQGVFQRAFHEGGQLVLENRTAPEDTVVTRSIDRATAERKCKARGEDGREAYESFARLDAAEQLSEVARADRRARERVALHACVDHTMGLLSDAEYATLKGLLAGDAGAERTVVEEALRVQRAKAQEVAPPNACEVQTAAEGSLLVKAQRLLRDGRSGSARAEDREALKQLEAAATDDASAPVWVALARARLYAGQDLATVKAAAENAAEVCPTWGVPDNYRATALAASADLEGAAAALGRALKRSPNYAFAHYNLGLVQFLKRQKDASLVSLDRALALDPLLGEAHYLRGRLLASREDYEGAVASLESAADLRPRQADVWTTLADVYTAIGNPGAAKLARERATTAK